MNLLIYVSLPILAPLVFLAGTVVSGISLRFASRLLGFGEISQREGFRSLLISNLVFYVLLIVCGFFQMTGMHPVLRSGGMPDVGVSGGNGLRDSALFLLIISICGILLTAAILRQVLPKTEMTQKMVYIEFVMVTSVYQSICYLFWFSVLYVAFFLAMLTGFF